MTDEPHATELLIQVYKKQTNKQKKGKFENVNDNAATSIIRPQRQRPKV